MEGPVNQTPQQPILPEDYLLEKRIRNGAHWFYWIAGMTLINTIAAHLHISWQFVIGTVFTQMIDVPAVKSHTLGLKAILIGIDLFVIAIYALVGYFATKKYNWAFITGIVLYGLDTLLMFAVLVFAGQFIGSALFGGVFHILGLLGIIGGLKANLALAKLQSRPVYYEPQFPAEF